MHQKLKNYQMHPNNAIDCLSRDKTSIAFCLLIRIQLLNDNCSCFWYHFIGLRIISKYSISSKREPTIMLQPMGNFTEPWLITFSYLSLRMLMISELVRNKKIISTPSLIEKHVIKGSNINFLVTSKRTNCFSRITSLLPLSNY